MNSRQIVKYSVVMVGTAYEAIWRKSHEAKSLADAEGGYIWGDILFSKNEVKKREHRARMRSALSAMEQGECGLAHPDYGSHNKHRLRMKWLNKLHLYGSAEWCEMRTRLTNSESGAFRKRVARFGW